MPDLAIPDTSCLIGLTAGGVLDLLPRLYTAVIVPGAVATEFGDALPPWIAVAPITDLGAVRALRSSLGAGETEVIALALERPDALAVLDDFSARQVARDAGVRFTCTAGIRLKAKAAGLLGSVSGTIDLMARAGFRFSSAPGR